MKLLARNLDRSTTEEELESMFKVFGKVQSCNLVIDKVSGKSKGFCFVEMPKVGELLFLLLLLLLLLLLWLLLLVLVFVLLLLS